MLAFLISAIAGGWWVSSIAIVMLSFLAALVYPLHGRSDPGRADYPPLTAIIPIKSLHTGFEQSQRSLFVQRYRGLEIVVAAAEPTSPAVAAAIQIAAAFPAVASHSHHSTCSSCVSPKLNNIWQPIEEARTDLVLIKDSNITMEPDSLSELVRCLEPDTGLVSAIWIATNPQSFAAWIEASIINCYHARVLMLADAAGLGFGLGKIMLFRRSDLVRAGGLECLAWSLGEDMALARAMGRLGLRTVLAHRLGRQTLGSRRLSEVWQRQLRWMVIWRVQLPVVFLGSILGSALPTAAAGAIAAPLLGLSPVGVAAITLFAWFCLELLLCIARRWPVSVWSPLAFLGRELLMLALWVRSCTTNKVLWGGAVRAAARETNAEASSNSASPSRAARAADE
jgi:ceramide glucosyltransferase